MVSIKDREEYILHLLEVQHTVSTDTLSELFDIALAGTRYLSIALLLCGFNIFASGFFTAYGNGPVSALISMSRALIMTIIGVELLGNLFGMTGIYLTLTFAEVTTLLLTFIMFRKYRDVYHYRFFPGSGDDI